MRIATIALAAARGASPTTAWVMARFGVSRATARRDLRDVRRALGAPELDVRARHNPKGNPVSAAVDLNMTYDIPVIAPAAHPSARALAGWGKW
ncbi:MAG: DeoR family transcriptional regulator [Egibacteraceae bacterium]